MSIATNDWLCGVLKDDRLSATQKAVAASLWSYMDAQGQCWPSLRAIGARAGIKTTEIVRLSVIALEAAGHLTRLLQPDGNRRPNRYIATGPGMTGDVVRHPSWPPTKRGAKIVRPPTKRGGRPPTKQGTSGPHEMGSELNPIELRVVTSTDALIADLGKGRMP